MRAILQRVRDARLSVNDKDVACISHGLLVYVCFQTLDTEKEITWLCRKLVSLRVFCDENGKFAQSMLDVGASLLLVPNFTLFADLRKGTRPNFSPGISFEDAKILFEKLVQHCKGCIKTESGVFGAEMHVRSCADGPVNLILDVPTQK